MEEYQDLFYLYCKIPDIFGQGRDFGSTLFVLQISLHRYCIIIDAVQRHLLLCP
jgi:hypothetical protein